MLSPIRNPKAAASPGMRRAQAAGEGRCPPPQHTTASHASQARQTSRHTCRPSEPCCNHASARTPSTSSIGFLAPLSDADADQYWRSLGASLGTTCHLFVLNDPDGDDDDDQATAASVQLLTDPKVTHAHRGEVAKLLVRPSARRRGLGRAGR